MRDEIRRLKKDIEDVRALSPGPLAREVAATGFHCKRCGKCCRGAFGDNTVTIFPSEIRDIMEATGLPWLDVARPHESDDVDEQGFCHTFEWALRRKSDDDCIFLDGGKCTVYDHRPLICRTYPLRLEPGRPGIESYECDGLGAGAMEEAGAGRMAEALLKRRLTETAEALSLLERYEAFRPGRPVPGADRIYVVHDSEGSRRVRVGRDGSCSFI